jgi:hypothetical protein
LGRIGGIEMPELAQAPYTLALIICDNAHVCPSTGKKTLLGIFDALSARSFPANVGRMVLYAALTDGRGLTTVEVRLVDCDQARKPILTEQFALDFSDPRAIRDFELEMVDIEFPESGEYSFQLWACNELLIERRIVVELDPGATP